MKELFLKVLAQSKQKPPAKPLDVIREAQQSYARCFQAANLTYTEAAAKAAFARQHSEQAGKMRRGDPVTRSHGLEDFVRDFETKQRVAKEAMRRSSLDALASAVELFEWAAPIADAAKSRAEKAEQEDPREWGVGWRPSEKVIALRQLSDRLHAVPNAENCHSAPARLVWFLDVE
jgi:hypothetical protein